jgi:hypothetical protein
VGSAPGFGKLGQVALSVVRQVPVAAPAAWAHRVSDSEIQSRRRRPNEEMVDRLSGRGPVPVFCLLGHRLDNIVWFA